MPNIGPVELIIVLVIVLVIFGARRVPEAGKNLGKGMREFKDAVTGNKESDHKASLEASNEAADERPGPRPAWARSGARPSLGARARARAGRDCPQRRVKRLAPRRARGNGPSSQTDSSRGHALARRAPRRAAHEDHPVGDRVRRGARPLLLAEPPDPADRQ